MAAPRRNPSLPGLKGLTRSDFDSWRAGRVRLEDIADRLGVGLMPISRKFKRWTKESAAAASAETTPTDAAPASPAPSTETPATPVAETTATPTYSPAATTAPAAAAVTATQQELPEFTGEDAAAVAKSAAIGILIKTHDLLIAPGALGASALKAAAAAVRDSVDMLGRLGVVDLSEFEEKPIPLVIRKLTDAEEIQIRALAELGEGVDFEPDATSTAGDPEE